MMKRFLFRYHSESPAGFVIYFRLGHYGYGIWLGYGKPVWWKPRLIGRGKADYGFGFGWLLLCCRVQVRKIEKGNVS